MIHQVLLAKNVKKSLKQLPPGRKKLDLITGLLRLASVKDGETTKLIRPFEKLYVLRCGSATIVYSSDTSTKIVWDFLSNPSL